MAITLRPCTNCILIHLHLLCTGPVKWSQATVVTAVWINMVFFNQSFSNYELSPSVKSMSQEFYINLSDIEIIDADI